MANNIRGNRVINPDHVADYRRVDFAHGSLIFICGLVLAAQAVVYSRFYPAESKGGFIVLGLGAAALLVGIVFGIVFAVKNRRRKLSISRPLKPLLALITFDKKTIDGEVVWDAAGHVETEPETARALVEADLERVETEALSSQFELAQDVEYSEATEAAEAGGHDEFFAIDDTTAPSVKNAA